MSRVPSICVVGDSSLDVSTDVAGPIILGGDHAASIVLAAGGQGANVAVRLARCGLPVRLVTALANDPAGDWLGRQLGTEGVEVLAMNASASTVVVILVGAGERTMLSDRAPLAMEGDALPAAIEAAGWIHCSGYVLRDAREAEPLVRVLENRPADRHVSIGGGSASDGRVAGELASAIGRIRPDLLVMGLEEARWLVDDQAASPESCARSLARRTPIAVVTAGPDGADLAQEAGTFFHVAAPADRAAVVDATGAGDAFAAGLVAALYAATWPPTAELLRYGLEAASDAGSRAARVRGGQGPIAGERRPAPAVRR